MSRKAQEIEDDVAELLIHLAGAVVQGDVFGRRAPSDAAKQQFRDALTQLIDDRIEASLRHVMGLKQRKANAPRPRKPRSPH